MPPTENRQNSLSEGLQIPGLVQSPEVVEQLAFSSNPTTPLPANVTSQLEEDAPSVLQIPGLVQNPEGVEQFAFSSNPTTPFPTNVTSQPEVDAPSGLQIPGLVQNPEGVEQLAFSNTPTTPLPTSVTSQLEKGISFDLANIDTARQLIPAMEKAPAAMSIPASSPGTTGMLLLEAQPLVTQALSDAINNAGAGPLRQPVVIRGSNKKRHSPRPPQGRRHVISIAVLILLVCITVGTLFAASPLGREVGFGFSTSPSNGSLIKETGANSMQLMAQQATATAVVHQQNDGLVPSASNSGPVVTGSPETWPLGVCTYWANLHYHQLTGVWVTWLGNAYQWAEGAREAGWNVSTSPHIPSIVVLEPGVQGASGYGHVAVAEKLVNSTTVSASNMNWYTNGGGWDIVSYYDFSAGPGVYFIWK